MCCQDQLRVHADTNLRPLALLLFLDSLCVFKLACRGFDGSAASENNLDPRGICAHPTTLKPCNFRLKLEKLPPLPRHARDDDRTTQSHTTHIRSLFGFVGKQAEDQLGPPVVKPSTPGAPQPSWGRLAEILKCLQSYGRLPASISPEEVDEVVRHGAWRWFTLLSPQHGVVRTASAPAGRALLDACASAIAADATGGDGCGGGSSDPAIRIYSCHDSTLIGIMQTLGLHGEAWPAYASVLQLELLESEPAAAAGGADACDPQSEYFLRASLNGETLTWIRHQQGQGQGQSPSSADDDGVVPFEAVRDSAESAVSSFVPGSVF